MAQASEGVAGAIDRSERPGHLGLLLTLAAVLVAAFAAVTFVPNEQSQAVIMTLLAFLAMAGVFFVFAIAVGAVRFTSRGGRDDLTKAIVDTAADGVVVDIGRASEALKAILAPLNYRNLDDLPDFAGRNTTTEFLAGHIHRRLSAALADLGPGGEGIERIRVSLHESHVARAWFEGPPARG